MLWPAANNETKFMYVSSYNEKKKLNIILSNHDTVPIKNMWITLDNQTYN
jgi:hypothetical protein